MHGQGSKGFQNRNFYIYKPMVISVTKISAFYGVL